MIRQIFIVCVALLSIEGFPQGKITRPTKKMQQQPSTIDTSQSVNRDRDEEQVSLQLTGVINGHEWVDLGLPSGTKWATCNIGAFSSSDYGKYYAWGELTTKFEYSINNCKTINKDMIDISGEIQYDVARVNWGSSWRLPTYTEMEELVDKCRWVWVTQNGSRGYKVIGPNGEFIFLPAAGWRNGTSLSHKDNRGHYWTSTPQRFTQDGAYYLEFYWDSHKVFGYGRNNGQSIRPVTK